MHAVRVPPEDHAKALPHGRNIRVGPPGNVEQLSRGRRRPEARKAQPTNIHIPPSRGIRLLQIALDMLVLPLGPLKHIREPAAGRERLGRHLDQLAHLGWADILWLDERGGAHTEHIRAVAHDAGREDILRIPEAAGGGVKPAAADAVVAARLNDGDALQAELHDLEALPAHVAGGPRVLSARVADGDDPCRRVAPAHERAVVAALRGCRVGVGVLGVAAGVARAVARLVEGGEVAVGFVEGVEERWGWVSS